MKTQLLLLLLFGGISSFAQSPKIISIKFETLGGAGDAIIETPLEISSSDNGDLFIDITGTAKLSDLDSYTFFLGEKKKTMNNDLGAKYNKDTRTIRLTLTNLKNDITDELTKIKIKKGDVDRFLMDIRKSTSIPPPPTDCPQTAFQQEAENLFKTEIFPNFGKKGIKDEKGIYVDKTGTIHLFVDHFGKYYGHDIPTVATEKNQFKIHLITATCYTSKFGYSFVYTGKYDPTFNIYNNGSVAPQNSGIKLDTLTFGSFGPFTGKFTFDLSKKDLKGKADAQPVIISHAEIAIHKLYHVSVTSGLIYTSLRHPQNISKMPMANKTDTTLVADDPRARGLITVMAIYYPTGRSFLYPPSGGIFDPSRIGIVVGTQLGQYAHENFFLGLAHDFATGGAISYGMHFGRRNIVSGKNDFKFGSDKFDLPQLSVNKEWNIGFFFGVTIDTRVAFQLLKSLTGTSTN